MPVDILKMAKPFVDAFGTDSREEKLVAAVVKMCSDLEPTVVAEGIERVEQAQELRRSGCLLGQGFLYAPAQRAEAFVTVARSLPQVTLPVAAPDGRARLRLASSG